ncbi:MAG: hypothetical protein ACYSOR_03595, partial [Planctomycetota bacterium]
ISRNDILFFPHAQGGGGTQIFLLGGHTAAAFADELRVTDQMGVLVRVVPGGSSAVEFAQVLIVMFA